MARIFAQSLQLIILSVLEDLLALRHLTRPSCEPRTCPVRESTMCMKEDTVYLLRWTARLSTQTGD
jgi:hypothetical protein